MRRGVFNPAEAQAAREALLEIGQGLGEARGELLACADRLAEGWIDGALLRRLDQVDSVLAALYAPDQPLRLLLREALAE